MQQQRVVKFLCNVGIEMSFSVLLLRSGMVFFSRKVCPELDKYKYVKNYD